METGIPVGFEKFVRNAAAKYERVLELASEFLTFAHALLQPPPKGVLTSLLRSVCLTITNSYQSVLLLTMNGCGTDALKIVRSMFESAVTVAYLQDKPDLLQDFLDYRWIKRQKHQEFLAQCCPEQFNAIDPTEIKKTILEYGRIKARFRGRSSWTDTNLREMAKSVGIEQQYLAVYPFTSSVHHLDVIGVMAQEDEGVMDVEVLPSEKNIRLALAIAGMSAYIALRYYDESMTTGKAKELEDWFQRYSVAQDGLKCNTNSAP